MQSAVRHLHAFVREVRPTSSEWEQAIDFLSFPRLTRLELRCSAYWEPDDLSLLRHFGWTLVHLRLSQAIIKPNTIFAFISLDRLEYLHLDHCKVEDDFWLVCAVSVKQSWLLPSLRALKLAQLRLDEVVADFRSRGNRPFAFPWIPREAKSVNVRVGANTRVFEKTPSTAN